MNSWAIDIAASVNDVFQAVCLHAQVGTVFTRLARSEVAVTDHALVLIASASLSVSSIGACIA